LAITPTRERVAKSRERRKRGLHPVQITVPDEVIDLLLARGYDLTRTDKASIAHALETFLSDAVLEGRDATRGRARYGSCALQLTKVSSTCPSSNGL
jgi:post-segregation antitoxin (ccd killing protein)